jgi:hypothetical protein
MHCRVWFTGPIPHWLASEVIAAVWLRHSWHQVPEAKAACGGQRVAEQAPPASALVDAIHSPGAVSTERSVEVMLTLHLSKLRTNLQR